MMYRLLLATLLAFIALPAAADMASKKAAMLKDWKQETVALGNNRFLIFSGTPGAYEYVYGIELFQIDGGIPHIEPLFMQEFNPDTREMDLSEAGVAISAGSYHFDKADNMLSYTSRNAEGSMRYRYKYKLIGDTFNLEEVIMQEHCADASCKSSPPEVIFKADAKTH